MKTLIIYSSKYGTTEQCAKKLSELINADLQNCDQTLTTDFSQYNQIILGSSVYAGQLRKNMKKYINRYAKEIKSMKLGLFLCSAESKNFEELFPYDLSKNSTLGHFGNELLVSKMNLFFKMVVKKMANTTTDVHAIEEQRILEFSKHFI